MGIKITDPAKLAELKRINGSVVHGDILDSFQDQLDALNAGDFNKYGVLVVSPSTHSLNYINNSFLDNVLVMNCVDVNKIKNVHPSGSLYLVDIERKLEDSVFAIGSKVRDDSVVVILDEMDGSRPIIASCCFEKLMGGNALYVNQVTSIYDKAHFNNFLVETWDMDKPFYKNEKTELYLQARRLQLPNALQYALSNNYNRQSFTKCQVEADIGIEVDANTLYKMIDGDIDAYKCYCKTELIDTGSCVWIGYTPTPSDDQLYRLHTAVAFEEVATWLANDGVQNDIIFSEDDVGNCLDEITDESDFFNVVDDNQDLSM